LSFHRQGRQKYALELSGNEVLGTVFGLKNEKIAGEWRKLRNEELNFYPLHIIISFYSINGEETSGTYNTLGA
jgi:hypothetical protein